MPSICRRLGSAVGRMMPLGQMQAMMDQVMETMMIVMTRNGGLFWGPPAVLHRTGPAARARRLP